ncbi:uncharacterized protein LOC141606935 [Silene latifolia]|uniref:uncharacterized protein LOC141606935 n=1 Tax=Silene latifolia TaxID=37657 RepID=UPI003D770D52
MLNGAIRQDQSNTYSSTLIKDMTVSSLVQLAATMVVRTQIRLIKYNSFMTVVTFHHVKLCGGVLPLTFTTDTACFTYRITISPMSKMLFSMMMTQLMKLSKDLTGSRTKFTAWLEYNKNHSDGRDLTYCEFPNKYVWNKDTKAWTKRKKGFTLGRIYHMSPNGGERFYLRTLLNFVKGPKSYEEIRTVNEIPLPTFKEVCYALGLLGDDKEYIDAIKEASEWGSGYYLRNLFATLLLANSLVKPELVWEETWPLLSDDILYRRRRELRNLDLQLSDEQLKNYALSEIEALLQRNGSSLRKFDNMPFPDSDIHAMNSNRLLEDELSYDKEVLKKEHEVLTSSMTDEQKSVYRKIMCSVQSGQGGVFFVYGYGGTGKTFLWRTLCAAIRCKGDIVIAVASSGIAAILLPGGRTAHARLSIPINVDENSTCPGIRLGTDLAELLLRAKLIIWDEAPMVNRFCIEALDRSLRDIMRFSSEGDPEKPFGGKVVVFGGDFRQILPVVPKGSRQYIVGAAISSSPLWRYCKVRKVLKLTKNMRLQVGSSESDINEIRQFSEWILEVGDGLAGGPNDGVASFQLPEDILLHPGPNPIATIVESTYPL